VLTALAVVGVLVAPRAGVAAAATGTSVPASTLATP